MEDSPGVDRIRPGNRSFLGNTVGGLSLSALRGRYRDIDGGLVGF